MSASQARVRCMSPGSQPACLPGCLRPHVHLLVRSLRRRAFLERERPQDAVGGGGGGGAGGYSGAGGAGAAAAIAAYDAGARVIILEKQPSPAKRYPLVNYYPVVCKTDHRESLH
jgi:hypothetical protein